MLTLNYDTGLNKDGMKVKSKPTEVKYDDSILQRITINSYLLCYQDSVRICL